MPRFVARQRKHKIQRKEASGTPAHDTNTNQTQLLPVDKNEKEEKRRKLKAELRAAYSNVSSKKQKRLDKYIETKLRKDEGFELLRKLENAKIDTTGLQSSRHLGKRTFNEYVEGSTVHTVHPLPHHHKAASEGSDTGSEDSFEQDHAGAFMSTYARVEQKASRIVEQQGSGLKQPLQLGDDGLPVIPMRQKKKNAKTTSGNHQIAAELPWEGFESEDGGLGSEDGELDFDDQALGSDISARASSPQNQNNEDEDNNEDDEDDGSSDDHLSLMSTNPTEEPRNSAFKSWATQQINKSLGHIPSYGENGSGLIANNPKMAYVSSSKTIIQKQDAETPQLQNASTNVPLEVSSIDPVVARQVFIVPIERPPDIQKSRMNLPIVTEEQKIMEAIHNNPVVLIWGSTGSGKTTQVPQFLFEAGYGSADSSTPGIIGVTQPRRVAAVSMAKRVAHELGQHGHKVSYQVRFDSNVFSETAIKYMTDGILLREISQDVALTKYSIIIIDEAHERSVNTDILIGMLSRIVSRRSTLMEVNPTIKPLKLVIMSATLRTSDFLQHPRLFQPHPPLIQAEGRQYDVTVHFSRRTERDYINEVCRKVVKGHRKLPRGGMLVFLTGQNEIKAVRKRLLEILPAAKHSEVHAQVELASSQIPLESEDLDVGLAFEETVDAPEDIDIITESDDEHDWEEEGNPFELHEMTSSATAVYILPLYSQLPIKEQLRVFEPPPQGTRLIVLATNVAETSLTIPVIRYVFDCGRSKERIYDQTTGVQSFEVNWISKASAEQRAGRAGRTEAGHCYRLYSSAVYERDFAQYTEPEILRTPIETVVLQLKSLHIDNVIKFPFPTTPSEDSLARAEKLLRNIGALSTQGQITTVGSRLGQYPVSPRLGKTLDISVHGHVDLVSSAIALVAGLSVADLFVSENQVTLSQDVDEEDSSQRQAYNKAQAILGKTHPRSDAMKILTAITMYAASNDRQAFCESMFLRPKAMQEVSQLQAQLHSIVRANNPGLNIPAIAPTLDGKQVLTLSELIAAGYIDQVAIRADQSPNPPESARRPKRAIDVPYLPLMPLDLRSSALEDAAIYLHASSVLARTSARTLPMYVVYSHLQQSQPSIISSEDQETKIRMFPLTPVTAEKLLQLAKGTPLLSYSKPVRQKIIAMSRGQGAVKQKRESWLIPSLVGRPGAIGWPLPAVRVVE